MAKRNVSSVNSVFIYHDNKNRSIYWDIFRQKGFLLTNEDVGKLMFDKASLPVAAILAYALVQFNVKLSIAIAIGTGLYIICKVLWRILFLYKCQEAKSFERGPLNQRIQILISKYSLLRLYALICLCAILIGLMIYSILAYKVEIIYLYIFAVLIACAAILMILAIIAIIIKSKQLKK